jgi:hypothetical protein
VVVDDASRVLARQRRSNRLPRHRHCTFRATRRPAPEGGWRTGNRGAGRGSTPTTSRRPPRSRERARNSTLSTIVGNSVGGGGGASNRGEAQLHAVHGRNESRRLLKYGPASKRRLVDLLGKIDIAP